MSDKAEKFREATEKVKELIEETKPTLPSGDTGRPENEREIGKNNIPPQERQR